MSKAMNKEVLAACEKAKEFSLADRFEIVYSVFMKRGWDPVICTNELIKHQYIKDRWTPVAEYKNGEELI